MKKTFLKWWYKIDIEETLVLYGDFALISLKLKQKHNISSSHHVVINKYNIVDFILQIENMNRAKERAKTGFIFKVINAFIHGTLFEKSWEYTVDIRKIDGMEFLLCEPASRISDNL